jgi:L-alanine-DL-glutamate epimerase-like enolase superfamily enzyme
MNRRSFLSAGAGATLAGCATNTAPEVSKSEAPAGPTTEQLEEALAKRVLDLSGIDSPVIIDSVELWENNGEQIVRVRSRDGAEGISLSNGRDSFYPVLQSSIIPFLKDKDARQWESELLWELYRFQSNYKLQGLIFWSLQAWVEFAVLDMLGRIANKSIGELMGGVVRKEIPIYVASGRRDSTPEKEVEYLQKLLDESGAKACKFRLGGRMSKNADASPGRSEGLIRLARKTFGDGIDLHGDANSSYDPEPAIRIGRVLEEVNAVYFEEPCPFDHLDDTKVVTDTLTIPVAGGEQEFSERRFRNIIRDRVTDIVQPDLHYYGGLVRSARVANMADLAGMSTTVHISGGFGFVYMLHFASRTKDIGKYQEYKLNVDKYNDWFDPKIVVKDGRMSVPEGPGVGIRDVGAVLKGAKRII